MKIAGVVALAEVKFGPIIYRDDFTRSIPKLARLGYDGVEISLRDPGQVDEEELFDTLKENDLVLSALATGPGALMDKLTFTDPDPLVRSAAIERIKRHVDLASRFSSRIIIGGMKGNLHAGYEGKAVSWFVDSFRECAEYAKDKKVNLLLETINRYEMNWLNTVQQGLAIIRKIDRDNVFLHIDTFHMNIEEPSLPQSIMISDRLLGYVHFADSNRWAPGYGHINFREVVDALDRIKYNGFLSFEILPMPDPDSAAKKGIETIKNLLM